MLRQHWDVDCLNAKGNFHFERTVRYRRSNDEDQEVLDLRHKWAYLSVKCLAPALSKRPNGSTWPATFCSGIRIGPKLPSNWPGIAPSPSARPIATSSRHNDSSTQSRSAMPKCPSLSSFRAVSYSDSAPTPLRPD